MSLQVQLMTLHKQLNLILSLQKLTTTAVYFMQIKATILKVFKISEKLVNSVFTQPIVSLSITVRKLLRLSNKNIRFDLILKYLI